MEQNFSPKSFSTYFLNSKHYDNTHFLNKGEKYMDIKELINLKNEFLKIKNMGYIESLRKGYTGIGKTFEELLGKKEDSLEQPDYHGIEIKTKRAYSKSYTTLFNATPKGKTELEIKRISNTYGYPDRILKNKKVLVTSIVANFPTLVANRYLFKLEVDYKNQRIWLRITNRNNNLLEKDIYWDFDILKEKLERKLTWLAVIKAWTKAIAKKEYYKYYDIQFFHLKDFKVFLHLLELGIVRITFKIGVYREGDKMGEIHDRGTGFEIQEQNMQKLFDKIDV